MGIQTDIAVPRFASPYFQAMINIIYTGHWIVEGMQQALKPLGMTEPQFNVLSSLYGAKGEPLCMMELQRRMVQKSSNVSRIVDRLEKEKLVIRETDRENRRKVSLRISEKGIEVFREARKIVQDYHHPLAERITAEEAEQLSAVLDRLREIKE